jgi:ATP:ADP antiporter, AAA family
MTPDTRPPQRLSAIVAIGLAATCLLCGYEFIRSVSTSLFIGAYGAKHLPIAMALAPVGTILLVWGYGWLLTRLGSRGALMASSLIAAAIIAGCYWALVHEVKIAAGVLYVFREAYIVVLVEQYWSFINSTVSPQQARLFNGPITGFGSLGAIAGAMVVNRYAVHLGSETLLLFAAASLIPAAILSDVAYLRGGEPQPAAEEAGGRQGNLALGLFTRSRYLMMLACLIMLTQAVSTALDLRFSTLVEFALPEKNARTAYLGGFYATLNTVAFVLQFGVVPLVMRLASLRLVHAAIPLIHVGAALMLLLHPSLLTGAIALATFKALDYSAFRAAKEILYIPLSYDARYRAKSVIDAFGYRFSKGAVSGLLALAGVVFGRLAVSVYPVLALISAGMWLPVVLRLTATGGTGRAAGAEDATVTNQR